MSQKIRVLVVDDSLVMRRVVSDILASEPDLDVQPPAASGALALARIESAPVDILVLDVEMPEMTGLDVLARLQHRRSSPVVIMFSASTQKAASTTLDALALGASDYVAKPAGTGNAQASVDLVRTQLLPKIRALGGRSQARLGTADLLSSTPGSPTTPATRSAQASPPHPREKSQRTPVEQVSPSVPSRPPGPASFVSGTTSSSSTTTMRALRASLPVDVLAIGASTGGPNALASVLAALPGTLSVPIVIVQHMPPVFTKMLAERLTATTPVVVEEAVQGQLLEPGRAYLAPGDHHLVVQRHGTGVVVGLNKDAPENSCRPSVDVLFRSVCATFGSRCLAVMLTGMGQDGLAGCRQLRAAGAQIVAQDEATSVVWGMPGFVVRAGLADAVKSLDEIPLEILRRLKA